MESLVFYRNKLLVLKFQRPAGGFTKCVSSLSAEWAPSGHVCLSYLWSAGQGNSKFHFVCPRSRPRVRSRELGSAILCSVES